MRRHLGGVDPQQLGERVYVGQDAGHGKATDVSSGAPCTEEELLYTVGLGHTSKQQDQTQRDEEEGLSE